MGDFTANKKGKTGIFPGYYVVAAAMAISLISGGTTTLSYYVNGLMVNEGLIDSTVSGLATSIVSLCSVLFSGACGVMHKRLGNKKAIMVGFLVPIVAFAMLGTLPASNMLMIAGAFFYGFCLVTISKIGTPTVVRKWFDLRASVPTALVIASVSMCSIMTKPISALVERSSYRSGWYFIMATCVVGLIITLLFIRTDVEECGEVPDGRAWRERHGKPVEFSKAAEAKKDGQQNENVMKNARFWIFGICSLLRMGVYAGSSAYITLMILSRGFTRAEAGACLASLTLSSTVGRLLTPVITKVLRISNQLANMLAHVVMFAGCMLLVTSTELMGFSGSIMLIGFAYGLGFVSQTLTLGDMFPQMEFSSLLGVFNTVINCSFVFPMVIGFVGKLLGENYFPIYFVFGIVNICAAVVLFVTFKTKKQELTEG